MSFLASMPWEILRNVSEGSFVAKQIMELWSLLTKCDSFSVHFKLFNEKKLIELYVCF
jgi:hypothetical protein